MKKKLLIILTVIVLFVGGYFILNEFKKKNLVSESQEKAVEYVMKNYEGVEKVNIDREYHFFDPMGGLSVGGHINNKDNLTFNITLLLENNEVGEVESIAKSPDFPDRKDGE